MVAHERALEWQELFDISAREKVPGDEVLEIAYRISGPFLDALSTCPTHSYLQKSFRRRSVISRLHESLSITPVISDKRSLLSSRAVNSQRLGGS